MKNIAKNIFTMKALYACALENDWDSVFHFIDQNPEYVYKTVSFYPKPPSPQVTLLDIAFIQGKMETLMRFQAYYKPFCMKVETANELVIKKIIADGSLPFFDWLLDNQFISPAYVARNKSKLDLWLNYRRQQTVEKSNCDVNPAKNNDSKPQSSSIDDNFLDDEDNNADFFDEATFGHWKPYNDVCYLWALSNQKPSKISYTNLTIDPADSHIWSYDRTIKYDDPAENIIETMSKLRIKDLNQKNSW